MPSNGRWDLIRRLKVNAYGCTSTSISPAGPYDNVNCKNYLCHFCSKQRLPAAIDLSPIKYVLNWRDDGMRERLMAGGWVGGAHCGV